MRHIYAKSIGRPAESQVSFNGSCLEYFLNSRRHREGFDDFEHVRASGTNPQKKHLLRRLVKKVLVSYRRTAEVWYGLPNRNSIHTPGSLAPNVPAFDREKVWQSRRSGSESTDLARATRSSGGDAGKKWLRFGYGQGKGATANAVTP